MTGAAAVHQSLSFLQRRQIPERIAGTIAAFALRDATSVLQFESHWHAAATGKKSSLAIVSMTGGKPVMRQQIYSDADIGMELQTSDIHCPRIAFESRCRVENC